MFDPQVFPPKVNSGLDTVLMAKCPSLPNTALERAGCWKLQLRLLTG